MTKLTTSFKLIVHYSVVIGAPKNNIHNGFCMSRVLEVFHVYVITRVFTANKIFTSYAVHQNRSTTPLLTVVIENITDGQSKLILPYWNLLTDKNEAMQPFIGING